MLYLTEEETERALEWPGLITAIETALAEISKKDGGCAPPRTILNMSTPLSLYTMPAYSAAHSTICCKLVTQCPKNEERHGLPSISAIIVLFNVQNGKLEAVLDAEAVTGWRTAAGSIVAAKHLYSHDPETYSTKTLAVLGAGQQGKMHIIGFQRNLPFRRVQLWNRTQERAKALTEELETSHKIQVQVFTDILDCVKDADVVVWAASSTSNIYLTRGHLKPGAFIVSVGTSLNMPSGLSADIFQNSQLFTESVPSANAEMKQFIEKMKLEFCEVGDVILGRKSLVRDSENLIVYQSLGSGMMDAAASKFVLENYFRKCGGIENK